MTLALLVTCLLVSAAGYALSWLNIRHLRSYGTLVPAGFEGHLDPEILRKTAAYTVQNNRVDLGGSIAHPLLVLYLLFGGAMGHYDRWIASLTDSFILRG